MSDSKKEAYRILLIDDNVSIHEDIRCIFDKVHSLLDTSGDSDDFDLEFSNEALSSEFTYDFQIDSAYQGQEGFELVKEGIRSNNPYSLVIVDVRMPPGWDGIETIAKLWEEDPSLQVVICTGFSDYTWSEIIEKFPNNDGLLVVKKPFDIIEVLQAVRVLTQKWSLRRKLDEFQNPPETQA
ncbi:MAG: response regulator [Proteobacteria bacterium]|nr:response regulator [Pseudomonadota bacterium]